MIIRRWRSRSKVVCWETSRTPAHEPIPSPEPANAAELARILPWLSRDTRDPDEISSFSWSILWIIPPSLAFLVVLPPGLGRGLSLVPALALACAVTVAAYGIWVAAGRAVGIGD